MARHFPAALAVALCAALAHAGDGGVPVPEVIVPPTASCPKTPDYPAAEKASGVKGAVVLRVTLDEKGQVTAAVVHLGLGPAFDAAALEAAKACTFTAASRNGVPSPAIIELSVDFVPPVMPWTLAGEVVGELGEALEGAEVRFGGQTARTDAQGKFSLRFEAVPPGDGWVLVAKDGFAEKGFPQLFQSGRTTEVRYPLAKRKVFETRVEGSRLLPPVPDVDRTPQVSHFAITRADIDRNPGALEDVTRVVQQVPGVAADPDLLATFFVRGGGPEEVVFYLDGVPLTNPYHLGGFASVFNPMMIESADFYAGGMPARYEPALSGVFEVRYATGETTTPKVWADVSMMTAKVRADVPLEIEGLSATVSFRRSYFEAYFAVLKAFKLFGANAVAPDITEFLARMNFRRGRHQTTASLIWASDGLDFVIKPGEELLVNFSGGLKVSNDSQLLILKHQIDLAGDTGLEFTAAYTHDNNRISIAGERSFANDAEKGDVLVRADLKWAHSEKNRSAFGLSYTNRFLGLTGRVTDTTTSPPWENLPFVETWQSYLEIRPVVRRLVLAAYGEHTWRPVDAFSVEAGARGQVDVASSQWSGSARLAAALSLPTATVIKASGGVAAQPTLQPLALDPVFGNPRLGPERSFTAILGVEQPLPIEARLRVEGWVKVLDQLVVNPDGPRRVASEAGYQNVGSGLAKGVDLLFLGRTRYFSYGASMALLASDRHNPLATVTRADYPAPWDQRFTLAAHLSYSPNDKWIFTGRFNFRTGRPYTKVDHFERDDQPGSPRPAPCGSGQVAGEPVARAGCWVPVFGPTNGGRYPGFYEISARAERRFRLGPLQMAAYLEVLNLTASMNLFAATYSTKDPSGPTEPELGAFNHLPIRPFLGVRAEY